MKAARIHAFGPPDRLRYEEVADPVVQAGEILVAVAATGVNPADLKFRSGLLSSIVSLPMPYTPGMDVAGTVVAIADGVERFQPGDRVMAMLSFITGGGYAERVAVPAEWCTRIPAGLDAVKAAALPTPGSTAIQLVENDLDVQAGQRVLVTGASGAVGLIACHAAKSRGAHVTAAVRHDKIQAVRHADEVIAVDGDTIASRGTFDYIVDTVGGSTAQALLPLLKRGGVVSSVATDRFANPDGLEIEIRNFGVKPDADMLGRVAASAAAGELVVAEPRTMKLSEAAAAHSLMEAGGAGKLVLRPDALLHG